MRGCTAGLALYQIHGTYTPPYAEPVLPYYIWDDHPDNMVIGPSLIDLIFDDF